MNQVPSITTNAATSITQTSFTANGNINSQANTPNITERGFAWIVGTSGEPDTDDNTVHETGSWASGSGAFSLGFSDLSPNTSYRVRAYGINSTGTGYGDTITVTTLADAAPPEAPTLSSPANESTDIGLEPTLSWGATDDTDNYHLQVSESDGFGTTVFDDDTLTSTSQQVGPLDYDTEYFWRVRGSNAEGSGDWSSTWSFTTEAEPAPPEPSVAPFGAGVNKVRINKVIL